MLLFRLTLEAIQSFIKFSGAISLSQLLVYLTSYEYTAEFTEV